MATNSKAELISTILSGGEVNGVRVPGAVDTVNTRMLDYSNSTNFDGVMKNLFPFWMFPSRSLPFWVKTMATHPEIIAFYNKVQRFSASARYQAGAVNSKGQPLTSMDGYVPIPGTDMWFNPLAPFSFRYVMDVTQSNDNLFYRQQDASDKNIPIEAYMAREFLETGPMFGFNIAPWMSYLMKDAFNISDETMPPFPMAPEILLMPRWLVNNMVDMAKKMHVNISGAVDAIYPESSWHDSIVEREILLNARTQMQSQEGPTAAGRKEATLEEVRRAIVEKGDNPLWKQTYQEVTNSEAGKSWLSFFTGVYPKEFTDAQADLFALRNELNLQKSAMNSQFQASIFDMPADAHERWQDYLDRQSTPDGWIYRLYTDINYVRNGDGDLIRDREERNKYLAMAIEEEVNQQSFYAAARRAQSDLQHRLMDIPIGAPYNVVSKVYEDYYNQIDVLETRFPFSYSGSLGSNKPIELIEEDLTNKYFKMLVATRPQFNPGEDYKTYQDRIKEWEGRLPELANMVMARMRNRQDINDILANLHNDQKLSKDFFTNLQQVSDADGIRVWNMKNDTIFDALNAVWKDNYWDVYWNTVGALSGQERELAERDFIATRPEPNEAEMYSWIVMMYGDKFSYEDVIHWMQRTGDVNDIDDRVLQDKGQDYVNRQDIWQMAAWIGPSKRQAIMSKIDAELFSITKDDSMTFDNWMTNSGNIYKDDPQKVETFLNAIKTVYAKLGISEPDREYQVEYVQAEEANRQFKNIINKEFAGNPIVPVQQSREPYQAILDIQSEYYMASDQGKKAKNQWIKQNPEKYRAFQVYNQIRAAYGNSVPIWAKYYLWKPGVPETLQNAMNPNYVAPAEPAPTTPAPQSGGSFVPESGSGGGNRTASVAQPNTSVALPWPANMQNTVGNTLVKEIEGLYSGERLSSNAITFLFNLKKRHPEWNGFIQTVLQKAGLISA